MQTVLTAFYHLLCHSNTSLQHKNRHPQCRNTTLYKRNTTSSFDAVHIKNLRAAGFAKMTSQAPVGHICQFLLLSSHLRGIHADRSGYLVTSATAISRKYQLSFSALPYFSQEIPYSLVKDTTLSLSEPFSG